MKTKFIFLTLLLLFARGGDFYSTSLWFFDNPSDEMNPLTHFFGFGWTGLILTNLAFVGLIIYGHYYYTFKYSPPKMSSIPSKLTDFVSELYFNEKGKFYQVFYKMPKNKNVFIGHTSYVLIRGTILGSILATIHNLCQFYNIPAYNAFREIVKRPLFVIYGLIISSVIYFSYRLWKSEYDSVKENLAINKNDL